MRPRHAPKRHAVDERSVETWKRKRKMKTNECGHSKRTVYRYVTFMWPCIVTNFFLIKPTDALISQIYFCQETLLVSGSSSAHHQEFSTVYSALVYVMQVWWQLSSTTILVVLESCPQTCMTHTRAESTVENSWWWAEELPETFRISWQ